MEISVVLNGRPRRFNVEPDEYLADTLRNHHITSVRRGCESSTCGVCTVLVDDRPVLSCTLLSVRADGKRVTTVEGIEKEIAAISACFGAEGADQCGFCNPGIALTAYALKLEYGTPTDEEIRHYLVGNLCRCSGYEAQLKAIKRYLGVE
ncbi:MAG: (2Fe-2S)-binding protein [Acholeplasmataceae bacterium]